MYVHLLLDPHPAFPFITTVFFRYEDILGNHCSNGPTVSQKKQVWETVVREFNAAAEEGSRTIEQLKALYKNLKFKLRKEVAETNVYFHIIFL